MPCIAGVIVLKLAKRLCPLDRIKCVDAGGGRKRVTRLWGCKGEGQ